MNYLSNRRIAKVKACEHSTIWPKWPVWLNGWVCVYALSGCRFESCCSHLNLSYRASFEQWVPWHSGSYGVHSKARMWHNKNIQSIQYFAIFFVLKCMFSIDNCKKKKKKKRKEKRQESIIKMGKTSSKTQLKFPYFDFFFKKKRNF